MPVTSTKMIDGLAFTVNTHGFPLRSDVPESLGGKNSGPTPHDYVEAGLAACTAITVQMYAKRKNIPLEYSDVQVKITAEGTSNEILREIHFVGNLTDEQKQSLFAIAEKCPVHKLLSAGAKITSVLV